MSESGKGLPIGEENYLCSHSAASGIAANSNPEVEEGMSNEEEKRLAVQLQKELEDLRIQTKSALESSWAEVERLQRDGSVSRERVKELEEQLSQLREASEARQRAQGQGSPPSALDFVFDSTSAGVSGSTASPVDKSSSTESNERPERRLSGSMFRIQRKNSSGTGNAEDSPPINSITTPGSIGAGEHLISNRSVQRRGSTGGMEGASVHGRRRRSSGTNDGGAFQSKLHENLTNALAITQDTNVSMGNRGRARRRVSCSGRIEEQAAIKAAAESFDVTGPPSETGVLGADDNVLPADMLEQLANLEQDKRVMVEELETKLKGKEAAIATLERTTSLQSSTVEALKKELAHLQHEAVEEDNRMNEEMDRLEQDHAANQEKALALEREIAKLELMLEERKSKEKALAEELAALEEQSRIEEQKAQEQIAELEEKLQKKREACSQIERENEQLRQSCNEEFEALRQDLMEFLPESKSEELIQQLMEQFAALKEKEEVLAEELAARMQDRQEILAALEKVSQVGKRVDAVVTAVEDLIDQLDTASGENDETKEDRHASRRPQSTSASAGDYKLNDREVAVACLNKALNVPKQIKESLEIVEGELMNLLDSMEVNGKHRPQRGQDAGSDALERAEALQEEAKVSLKEVEAELMDLLASLEEHSCDVVDELEAELASKDAALASLESTTAKQEQTIESLTAELARLQSSSKEESQASLAVMDNLQREVNSIVEGIAEKDQMISTLSKVLEEREANKAALQKELTEIRGKLTTLDPACPRDQCHAVL